MSEADVVAVYRWGDEERDRNNPRRTRHTITERALGLCDAWMAKRLRGFMGDVVVVASSERAGRLPAVITVMPKGVRTR